METIDQVGIVSFLLVGILADPLTQQRHPLNVIEFLGHFLIRFRNRKFLKLHRRGPEKQDKG